MYIRQSYSCIVKKIEELAPELNIQVPFKLNPVLLRDGYNVHTQAQT